MKGMRARWESQRSNFVADAEQPFRPIPRSIPAGRVCWRRASALAKLSVKKVDRLSEDDQRVRRTRSTIGRADRLRRLRIARANWPRRSRCSISSTPKEPQSHRCAQSHRIRPLATEAHLKRFRLEAEAAA